MSSELKEAAERVLAGGCELCRAEALAWYFREMNDETPLLNNYHTGDDWRDPWLRSIGFKPDDEQEYLFVNAGADAMFDLQAWAAGPWRLADPEGEIQIPRPKTRGEVLRLMAALNISPNGTK